VAAALIAGPIHAIAQEQQPSGSAWDIKKVELKE